MSELIDRKALVKDIYNIKQTWSMDKDDYIDEMMSCINNAQAVEERTHGRWKYIRTVKNTAYYECQNCKHYDGVKNTVKPHKFCKWCGAIMDEVSEDDR